MRSSLFQQSPPLNGWANLQGNLSIGLDHECSVPLWTFLAGHSARIVVPVYDCGHRKPDVHLGQRPKHLLLYETSAMGDITCFTRLSGIWINGASDGVMNTNQLMRESAPEQILQISRMEQMFFLSGFRAIMRDIN